MPGLSAIVMETLRKALFDYWHGQPQWKVVGTGVVAIAVIGIIDYYTTVDLSLSFFYLLPVTFVGWFAGKRLAVLVSFQAAVVWLFDDLVAKPNASLLLLGWNATINFGFFSTISYLLGMLKQSYDREQHLARTDALTGAINRRYFMERLQNELARAQRQMTPLTIAYLDIDDFKAINDQHGHSTGDRVLTLIAELVHGQIRSIDLFARLGGDEFVLLLPQTDRVQAETVLHRLRHRLHDGIAAALFPVGLSIGAITYQQLPDSADVMLEQADRVMYAVKRDGKNAVRIDLVDSMPEPTAD